MNYTLHTPNVAIHKIYNSSSHFAINPETGRWMIIEEAYIEPIRFLTENSVDFDNFANKYSRNTDILKPLFFHGLLKINGEYYWKENKEISIDKALPMSIVIKTTKRCNLNCSYCYASSASNENPDFNLNLVSKAIEKLRPYYGEDRMFSIIFHGGEPLLRYKELTHVISSLRSSFKNISFAIQSNGILIDQDVANFIKSNHITIGISIDGSNREANKNRLNANNDPKFEKIQNGINTLLSNKIDIGIISVISKENLAYLIDSFDYFVSKGIKRFSYNMFIPAGNGSGKDQDVEIDSLVAFYVKIACKINDYNLKKELNQYIGERSISSMINSLIFKTFQMCYTSPCGAGQHLIAIDTNGDVYPCDDFIESKIFTMGNIGDDTPFETMLTNQMFIKLRNRSIDTIPQCSKCSIKHLCIYKCPSNSFYYHDSLYFSHRMCRFSKKIIPAFMELLHTGRIESRYFKPF